MVNASNVRIHHQSLTDILANPVCRILAVWRSPLIRLDGNAIAVIIGQVAIPLGEDCLINPDLEGFIFCHHQVLAFFIVAEALLIKVIAVFYEKRQRLIPVRCLDAVHCYKRISHGHQSSQSHPK